MLLLLLYGISAFFITSTPDYQVRISHERDESRIPWATEYESARVCELRWSVSLPLHGCLGPPQTFLRQDAAAQSCVGTDRSSDLLLSPSPHPLPPAQRRYSLRTPTGIACHFYTDPMRHRLLVYMKFSATAIPMRSVSVRLRCNRNKTSAFSIGLCQIKIKSKQHLTQIDLHEAHMLSGFSSPAIFLINKSSGRG